MISIERFNEIVEEELALLPEYVFEELNGGVIVDEKINLHPKRMADDLYIMGTYSTSPVMGKQIVLYYGSFARTMPYADEDTLRLKIRDTIRHEFRHHMETRAGFFGKGTLIDEDKQEMDRYYLMHAKREASESPPDQIATDGDTRGADREAGDVAENGNQSRGAATVYEINPGATVYLPGTELSDERKGQENVMPAGYAGVKYVCHGK